MTCYINERLNFRALKGGFQTQVELNEALNEGCCVRRVGVHPSLSSGRPDWQQQLQLRQDSGTGTHHHSYSLGIQERRIAYCQQLKYFQTIKLFLCIKM